MLIASLFAIIFCMSTKTHDTGCLVAYALNTFGDRWTMLIIRDMLMYGKRRYGDFLQAGEGIATNILAERLKHLESEGVLEKDRDPENRRSYVYSLTEKGLALAPILVEILQWSGRFAPPPDTRRKKLLKRAATDREALIEEFRAIASSAKDSGWIPDRDSR